MEDKKNRYFYQNLLANQNITAKNNIVWVADITSIKLSSDKKLFMFICIDIHTNLIISYAISTKVLKAKTIVKSLSTTIKNRLSDPVNSRVILHTDRGSQFSSQTYYEFFDKHKSYITASMSRDSSPKDNSVCERYMRTFKSFKINGRTLEQTLNEKLKKQPNFKSYRMIVSQYVKMLNEQPNKKTFGHSPNQKDKNVEVASRLMLDPIYSKAFSRHFGYDPRLFEIEQFKSNSEKVIKLLEEVAHETEVVSETPFDSDTLENKFIIKQIDELKSLIQSNPELTREYVLSAISPIEESLNDLHTKMDKLLPKAKKARQTMKLRDPIDRNLFPIFLKYAGSASSYKRQLRASQLRICYTILYHIGLRLNEIRYLTEQDIYDAIENAQFSVIHYKTKQAYNHVLNDQAIKDLKCLEEDFKIVFKKNNFKYIFGKTTPIHSKSLIRMVNKDLKNTCKINDIYCNVKSHSFRINMISNLLRVTTLHNTASIVGHTDIRSTLKYKRYALSKLEIQKLLTKIQTLD